MRPPNRTCWKCAYNCESIHDILASIHLSMYNDIFITESFKYEILSGVVTPSNYGSPGRYQGDFSITFQRIHLITPFTF